MSRKLAHFRHIGQGNPGWSGTARYEMAGADPSVSFYDQELSVSDANNGNVISSGFHWMRERLPLSAPTMNRRGRASAVHSTVPAARFFQGYFNTSFAETAYANTSPLGHQPLNMNNNPGGFGTKEAHPATVYDPFPAASALYPKAV